MLAGHLGGEDAYTFVGEGGGIRLASIAVFKRDIIARLTLGILLDFEIGAGILVSGGCHRVLSYLIIIMILLFIV